MDQKTTDPLSQTATIRSPSLGTDEHESQQRFIGEILKVLSGATETLNNDIRRLGGESLQHSQSIEATNQCFTPLKTSCEESNAGLSALSTNMMILQEYCFSLRQKFEATQSTSYDGTLVWKITNFQKKMSTYLEFLANTIRYTF